jgi:hypothetical protein
MLLASVLLTALLALVASWGALSGTWWYGGVILLLAIANVGTLLVPQGASVQAPSPVEARDHVG